MNIRAVIKKISDTASVSSYIRKRKGIIKKSAVFCDCDNMTVPVNFTRSESAVNANFIITHKPLPEYFIKKNEQVIAFVCEIERSEASGKNLRTMLMADYILIPQNMDEYTLFGNFHMENLFRGTIVKGFGKDIIQLIADGKIPNTQVNNHKKNVLIYSGSLAQNGLTASLLNLLACLKNDMDTNYIITYREQSLEKFPERVNQLPENLPKMPMTGTFMPSLSELICYILYFKLNITGNFISRRLDRFFKREWQRFFGMMDIDIAIQFTGYEYGVIKLFENFSGKRIIYVHNDMVSEINVRKNQHLNTLREAYVNYDITALVTEDMRKSAMEISGGKGFMTVVPNCHNYKRVIERSLMPVEFQPETECNVSLKELEDILDSDMEKFITIGRFSPEKAHMRLIDAFGKYCREHSKKQSCLIIIGGRGELYEQTLNHARQTGLNIILIRSMSNPMPVLKKCSLFILPSEYEGLGLVLLEADTLGIPVFATDVPGPSGFLKKYQGILVENSLEGIVHGMMLFSEGKIQPMSIDYEEYNRSAADTFRKILE